jgi:hypothetical protein
LEGITVKTANLENGRIEALRELEGAVFSFGLGVVMGEVWLTGSEDTVREGKKLEYALNQTFGREHEIGRGLFHGYREMWVTSIGEEVGSGVGSGDIYEEKHTYEGVFLFSPEGYAVGNPKMAAGVFKTKLLGIPVKEFKLEWIVGIASGRRDG